MIVSHGAKAGADGEIICRLPYRGLRFAARPDGSASRSGLSPAGEGIGSPAAQGVMSQPVRRVIELRPIQTVWV